jgi:hypothetical protein
MKWAGADQMKSAIEDAQYSRRYGLATPRARRCGATGGAAHEGDREAFGDQDLADIAVAGQKHPAASPVVAELGALRARFASTRDLPDPCTRGGNKLLHARGSAATELPLILALRAENLWSIEANQTRAFQFSAYADSVTIGNREILAGEIIRLIFAAGDREDIRCPLTVRGMRYNELQ